MYHITCIQSDKFDKKIISHTNENKSDTVP